MEFSEFPIWEEDVFMRQISSADIDYHKNIVNWRNDPETRKCFYSSQEISLQEHLVFFSKTMKNPDEIYAGIFLSDQTFVGMAALYSIDRINKKAEYGRLILDPKQRGKRIGSKIDQIITKLGFNKLGLNKLYAEVFEENKSVVNLHLRAGFKVDGKLRQHILKDGVWKDVILISMLREDYSSSSSHSSTS